MSIIKKVGEIEELFAELDKEISDFQSITKLSCLSGCGKCCTHNEVDASPLEFFPWAYQLYLNGEAVQVLRLLSESESNVCQIYKPFGEAIDGKGSCGDYVFRGLICRLFGYAANTDKYGKLRLATCKIIKEDQSLAFLNAEKMISKGLSIPVFTHYYLRLSQIDFQLGNTILPINAALKVAIEEILHYFSYRDLESEIRVVA